MFFGGKPERFYLLAHIITIYKPVLPVNSKKTYTMQKTISLLSLLAVMLFMLGCNSATNNPEAKYVFLFIGDGMGINQVYATELYKAALEKNIGYSPLTMSTFPVQSQMTTYSANSYVTCSSAAGTAMATGHKTRNGVLGKDTSLTVSFESIAIKAKKSGYKVGIVSSVGINHATPASFYANQDKRSMYYQISMQLPQSNFDYFGGGGFIAPNGKNNDQPCAYQNAVNNGYTYINSTSAFDTLKNGHNKILAVNPVILGEGEMPWTIDSVNGSLTLADFTRKGIELLNNPKGFFMMVEGGKIDWACHGNETGTAIHEVIAFDQAVETALQFYKKYPDQTLIIVTADHETGGLAVANHFLSYKLKPELLAYQKVSSGVFVDKIAKMVDSKREISFTEFMDTVTANFGLNGNNPALKLTTDEEQILKKSYSDVFINKKQVKTQDTYLDTDSQADVAVLCINLLNKKSGFGWTTNDHSAAQVPVKVIGAGQQYFTKTIDNTDIPKLVAKTMGIEF